MALSCCGWPCSKWEASVRRSAWPALRLEGLGGAGEVAAAEREDAWEGETLGGWERGVEGALRNRERERGAPPRTRSRCSCCRDIDSSREWGPAAGPAYVGRCSARCPESVASSGLSVKFTAAAAS